MNGYSLSEAAAAAGCTTQNIATWIHRDLVVTDIEEAKAGLGRRYSRINVYEFAVLKQMSRLGVPLRVTDWMRGVLRTFVLPNEFPTELLECYLVWTESRGWDMPMAASSTDGKPQRSLTVQGIIYNDPSAIVIDVLSVIEKVDEALASFDDGNGATERG